MNFSPKHSDTRMRAVYAILVISAFLLMSFGTGLVKTLLLTVGFIALGVGLYLFIKCDVTTYTYIVMENEGRDDFYVDKAVGKRGAYVCYYPLSDAVCLEKYEKGKKAELYQRYGKVFVYNYCHNLLSGEKHILVFKNEGYYDAVIIELDKTCLEYLNARISKEKEQNN